MSKFNKTGRFSAGVMAALLTVQPFMAPAVYALDTNVRSVSENQMTSEPEAVYVNSVSSAERDIDFDANWKFNLGDASGAEEAAFNDSRWESVNLPHDYSIEQEYTSQGEAESGYLLGGTGWYRKNFTVDKELEGKKVRIEFGGVYMNATVYINGHKLGIHPYGYTQFSFDLSDYLNYGAENTIAVKVEHNTPSSRFYSGSGIYRSVKLNVVNPVHIGLYGFRADSANLEAELTAGQAAGLRMRTVVDNESSEAKTLTVKHTVYKKGDLENAVASAEGQVTVAAGASEEADIRTTVANPDLWSIKTPNLYTIVTEVVDGDQVIDTMETDYGFRYMNFDKDTGFSLNGENVKIKGVCMHHDQGSLGAEAYYRAIERQVEKLKEMGANLIRVTHNPASEDLLKICSEKGMMVINEAFDGWVLPKNGNYNDYSTSFNKAITSDNEIIGAEDGMVWSQFDLETMVRSEYNEASVMMISLGNEVQEGTSGWNQNFLTAATNLINWTTAIDTTRPVTTGDNNLKGLGYYSTSMQTSIHNAGGVVGGNYCNGSQYDEIHSSHPEWALFGSETASHINSRGVYDRTYGGGQTSDKKLTSYDNSAVGWGAVASSAWYDVITRDFVMGEAVWTGFDYLGEPTPWNGTGSGYVSGKNSPKSSYFGIIDTAGFEKDNFYFYQSQWNDDVTTLHVLPAWNSDVVSKDSSGNVPVVVYSDAAAVELKFTDKAGNTTSYGKKSFTKKTTDAGHTYQVYEGSDKDSTAHKNLYLQWKVPYADGTLEAIAYDEAGNVIDSKTVKGNYKIETTGEEKKLDADADRTTITADGKDLTYITIDVQDEKGRIVPDADNNVQITVEGDGVLVGMDNGFQADYQSYQDDNRNAFNGKVLAIVQSTKEAGSFTVTAKSAGLDSDTVTVTTVPATSDSSAEKQIQSLLYSRIYYVKTGTMPTLPSQLQATYTDGSKEYVDVTWDAIDESLLQSAGTFTAAGKAGNISVSVNINVIDNVASLLNYSTTTPVGFAPSMPASRPAVLTDGTIMSAAFDVNWEMPEASAWSTAGTVVVNGTANVLGQEVPVTATVRVQEAEVTIGDSISSQALTVTQDVPAESQSDTLEAIYDDETAISDNSSGGANPTCWTNYTWSQAGNTTSAITFEYATQQQLGEIVIHFARDSYSMRLPEAGKTVIEISDDGTNWTTVNATETIGTASGRVTPYTYSFAPITATFIRFNLTNTTVATGTAAKPCTGITEIELKASTSAFTTHSDAGLESLKVNGKELSAADLDAGEYTTPALWATVEAVGKNNAAVTVLPAADNQILILTEAEDGSRRSSFTIHLNGPATADPDSSELDIATEHYNVSAASDVSYDSHEGQVSFAFDNDPSSHWHTNWQSGATAPNESDRWIQIELDTPAEVSGMRYLPRSYNGKDGRMIEYRLEAQADGSEDWVTVGTGTVDRTNDDWQFLGFDAPMTVKRVRLTGVHTWANSSNDKHMSVAELRLVASDSSKNIGNTEAGFAIDVPETVELTAVSGPVMPEVTVTHNGEKLVYGIDYKLDYANNEDFGEATVTITGICDYNGTVTRTFNIVKKSDVALSSVFVKTAPAKLIYTAGETFDPTGLVLRTLFEDGSEGEAAYADEASEFTFAPALDQALTTADKEVTVTYQGKYTTVEIGVQEKQEEDTTKVKELLHAAILYAENIMSSDTFETLAPAVQTLITNAYNNAQAVYNKEDATFDECADAWKQLTDAIHYAGFFADKALLQEKFDSYSALDLSGYTEESAAKLTEALANAKAVLDDENALQERIDAAVAALDSAYAGLTDKPVVTVDKYLLGLLIDKSDEAVAEADTYLKNEAWTNFEAALASAKTVYEDANATEADVEAAVDALSNAYMLIRKAPDEKLLEELKGFIALAATINRGLYTADELNRIDAAVLTANNLLAADNFDNSAASRHAEETRDLAKLISDRENKNKPADPTNPDPSKPSVDKPSTDGDTKPSTKPATKPATNDKSVSTSEQTGMYTMLAIAAVALIGGIFLFFMNKKKKPADGNKDAENK